MYATLPRDVLGLRNVCFPRQVETLKSNPPPEKKGAKALPPLNLESKPMVNIDKSKYEIRWIEAITTDLIGKSWEVNITETADDYDRLTLEKGFDIYAKYEAISVKDKVVKIKDNSLIQKNFLDPNKISEFKTKITCWSISCPDYVKFNDF